MNSPIAGAAALFRREAIRFVRQPSRIVAAVGTPLLVWLILASGFAGALAVPAADVPSKASSYAAFLLPGAAAMVALFSSVFAALSLIEDRAAGFLQSVLVSPVGRASVVAAKLASCSLLSTLQGASVLAAAPLIGVTPPPAGFLLALAALAALSLGIAGIALAAAWFINSSQGFHGVMNLVLMPMWLLSSAVFPAEGAATWFALIVRLNPVSHPLDLMRDALADRPISSIDALASLAFAAAGVVLSALAMRRR